MKTVFPLISVLLVILCLAGCASLKNLFSRKESAPPQAFTTNPQPTLEQITWAVNKNSQAIRNFSTENASISMPGIMIPLHSRLTFERPKRLRVQGPVSGITNLEFDFGSNDLLFWLWTRRGGNEMWYCRHDQFPTSPVRSKVPIDPDWLISALGIVEFKPADQHFGPTRNQDGNWEIISHCQTPSGQYTKRTVIDSKVGWVIRQELYTPQNELAALAEADDLRFDRVTGVYYVKRVSVQCQGMDGKMTIDLGTPTFNSSAAIASSMFVMPMYEGYRAVDLCSPEFLRSQGTVMPTATQTILGTPVPEASIQTLIR